MTITDKLNIDKLNHDIEISDLQSDSDLGSIRNSCNFFAKKILNDFKHTFSNRCKLLGLLLTSFYQAEEEGLVGRGRNKDSVTAYHQSQNRGKRFGLRFIRQFTV